MPNVRIKTPSLFASRIGPALLCSLLGVVGASTSGGCAHMPRPTTIDTSLELEQVVLYRNGVGYFERAGEVTGDVLRIRVRKDQVNDLLKSLTVVDRNGQAVSVSMPLDPQTWSNAALARMSSTGNRFADTLDSLKGAELTLVAGSRRIKGRMVMVELIVNEPMPEQRRNREPLGDVSKVESRDYRITLLHGNEFRTARLSEVTDVRIEDGDLAMQLHRRLDAGEGEGLFEQIDVDIRLIGEDRHDLTVSYVVSAPMWKPTYRVVLDEDGENGEDGKGALLQGWAVVDNTSGEDWSNIHLSLTSGSPIAFQYDMHTPRNVEREDLTASTVHKTARVALGEAHGDIPSESKKSRRSASRKRSPTVAIGGMGYDDKAEEEPSPKAEYDSMVSGSMSPAPAPRRAQSLTASALEKSTRARALAKDVAGLTRIDLSDRVTVPDGSSTMVAVFNERVQAQEAFLFRPGEAGRGYEQAPYRVVRFMNSTPYALEPGPISIYSGGTFVGEGLSEAVGTKASVTIPFSVEPGLQIQSAQYRETQEVKLVRIVNGYFEVTSYEQVTTTWTVEDKYVKSPKDETILIRHRKQPGNFALQTPPEGTETLSDAYLVPVVLRTGEKQAQVKVVERRANSSHFGMWDGRTLPLLESVVSGTNLPKSARNKLQPAIQLRQRMGKIDTQIAGFRKQQGPLDKRARQIRSSLKAIATDKKANSLRKTLNKDLAGFIEDANRIGREILALEEERLKLQLEYEATIQNMDLSF